MGLLSGAAVDAEGRTQASMGVAIADYDHDGRADILVTTFTQEGADLFWNRGDQGFEQVSGNAGLLDATFPYVGWGRRFLRLGQ